MNLESSVQQPDFFPDEIADQERYLSQTQQISYVHHARYRRGEFVPLTQNNSYD